MKALATEDPVETVEPKACCSLPDVERRARETEIEGTVARRILEVRELDDGFAFGFARDEATIEEIGRFIAFESRCCGFLGFRLDVPAGEDRIWLELGGSTAARDFVRAALERWKR